MIDKKDTKSYSVRRRGCLVFVMYSERKSVFLLLFFERILALFQKLCFEIIRNISVKDPTLGHA